MSNRQRGAALAFLAITLSMGAQYRVDNWDTRSGMPQNAGLALAQTRDGYLWIGTEQGLARFDGKQFVALDRENTPGLASAHIRALRASRDGALWVGTNRGLTRRMGGTLTSYTTRDGLPSDVVNSVFESHEGDIWIATSRGVATLSGGRIIARPSDVDSETAFWSIAQSGDGAIWFASDVGLMTLRGTRVTRAHIDGLPHEVARAITAHGTQLWIGWRDAAVTEVDLRTGRARTTSVGAREAEILSINHISDGSVLIGTGGDGLSRLANGRIQRIADNDRLGKAIVWSLLEDRQGNVWVGTSGMGVFRLKTAQVRTVDTKQGLSNDIALAVLGTGDGAMWVGTAGGGLNRMRGGRIDRWSTKDGLPSDMILALARGRDNNVWIGTPAGLSRFDGRHFRNYTRADGLSSLVVRSIVEDKDGSLWIGTRGGGLNHLRDGRMRVYSIRDGLSSNIVTVLRWRSDGALMVGLESGGLAFVRNGAIMGPSLAPLRGTTVQDILEDADGTLWLATVERGLARVRGEGVTFYRKQDGLLDDVIHAVRDDGAGNLWCSTNRGIFRLSRKSIDSFDRRRVKTLSTRVFGESDGMLNAECNGGVDPTSFRDAAGTLWFPTVQGLAAIDPARLASAAPPARPEIQRVVIDGVEHPLASTITLRPNTRNVQVEYATIDLSSPERLSYRYRLDGFDDDWIGAGDRRVAYFNNLPAGTYTLLLQAVGSDGQFSDTMVVPVIAEPHFIRGRFFQLAVLLAILAIGVGLHRWRTTALRRRNEELTTHIRERERAEREVRHSEERFRALIEHASDVIAIIGRDGTIRYISPSCKRVLGREPEAVIGLNVRQIVERPDEIDEFRKRVQDSEVALAESFRVRRADGHWVSLEVIGKRAVHIDGIEGLVINCRDTTERTIMQQQLEQAKRLNSLGRLAATVSHEFNNVLMGIQPFLYLLQRHAPDNANVQSIASKIETSVKRGKQITSQILRYTRPSQPSIENVPVNDWLAELVPELQGLLGTVWLDVHALSNASIAADREQLTQVMLNLVINARDAIHPNPGMVTIECREEVHRRFTFGVVNTPERYVHIKVKDNGRGIPSDVLPHIFEPLFTTKRERGTGLGLAIVHQVVERHAGLIFVESTVGVGTTFHLFLPKAPAASLLAPGAENIALGVPRTLRRVLIVEDEPAVAEGLAEVLRAHRVEAKIVDHVAAAPGALKEFQPDLVILDVALPDGDGIDLYRLLMKTEKNLPVVFSTAHESEDRLTDLLRLPHVAFLQKPYDEADLVAELRRCMAAA